MNRLSNLVQVAGQGKLKSRKVKPNKLKPQSAKRQPVGQQNHKKPTCAEMLTGEEMFSQIGR